MFCVRCGPLTRRLGYDPAAEPHVELMTGSCIWPDELSREWCIQCKCKTREWFYLRYQITVGDPIPAGALERWQELEREYPSWPFFLPERRSADIAEQVRKLVHRANRRACVDLARMDREYRKDSGESQK
jgi:hypothetical protein